MAKSSTNCTSAVMDFPSALINPASGGHGLWSGPLSLFSADGVGVGSGGFSFKAVSDFVAVRTDPPAGLWGDVHLPIRPSRKLKNKTHKLEVAIMANMFRTYSTTTAMVYVLGFVGGGSRRWLAQENYWNFKFEICKGVFDTRLPAKSTE
jgi:hypothetical protein